MIKKIFILVPCFNEEENVVAISKSIEGQLGIVNISSVPKYPKFI